MIEYASGMKCALFLVVLLSASGSAAQSMPVEAPHPETGEHGTWIPDWLKLHHLQDNERLKQCVVDLSLSDDELQQQDEQIAELYAALDVEMKASQKLELSLGAVSADSAQMDARFRRRTAAMWVLLGGFVVATSVAVFEVAR